LLRYTLYMIPSDFMNGRTSKIIPNYIYIHLYIKQIRFVVESLKVFEK
jgi:hypothetical protein